MKTLLALSVMLAHLILFGPRVSESWRESPPAIPPNRAALTQGEGLCDECICDSCNLPSEPLPRTPVPCPAVIETKWDLWRAGTCLRGVNTWQKTYEKDGLAYLTYAYRPEDFVELKRLKANYVNVSFPGIYSVRPKGEGYVLEPEVLKELKLMVKHLRESNLFAVVAFRTGPGRNEAVFGGEKEAPLSDVWTSPAARDAWVAMWKEASAALKDETNVVGYDLMVEPVGDKEKVADAAGNRERYRLWYDLAGKIAKQIRDGGDETPILVGGANGSSACSLACLPAITSSNVVYTAHQYEPFIYTHQAVGPEGEEEQQKSEFDCKSLKSASPRPRKVNRPDGAKGRLERIYSMINGFRSARGRAPVVINEFGVYRWAPSVRDHLRDEIGFIERLGANHALWLWEPLTPCVGYDEFNFRHGTDFSKHRDDPDNSLVRAIGEHWRRNTAYPNTVTFRTGRRP